MAFEFENAKYVFDNEGKLYLYVHDKGGKDQHIYISLEGNDKGGAYVAGNDKFKNGLKPIKAFKEDSGYDIGNAGEEAVKVDLVNPGTDKKMKAGTVDIEGLHSIVEPMGFFTYAQMEIVSYINDQKEVCSEANGDFGYVVNDCTLLKKGDNYYIRYCSSGRNSIRESKYRPGKKLKDEEKITNESQYIYYETGVFVNAALDSSDEWDSTPLSDYPNLSNATGFKEIFLDTGKLFFDLLDVKKPIKNGAGKDGYLLSKRGTDDLFFYNKSDGTLAKCGKLGEGVEIKTLTKVEITEEYVDEKGNLVKVKSGEKAKDLGSSYFGKRFVTGGKLKDKTQKDETLDSNISIGEPGLIVGSGDPIKNRKGIHLINMSNDHYFFDLENGFLIKCKNGPAKDDNKVEADADKVLDKDDKKFKKLDVTDVKAKGCEERDELKNLVGVKKAYFDLGLELGNPLIVDGDGAIANKKGIYLKGSNTGHYFYDLDKGGLVKCDGAPVGKKITCSNLANKVLNPDSCKFESSNLNAADENKAKKILEEIGFTDPGLCSTLKQNKVLFDVVKKLEFNDPCVAEKDLGFGKSKYLSFKNDYYYGISGGELLKGNNLSNSAFDKKKCEFVQKIKKDGKGIVEKPIEDKNKKIEEVAILKDFLDSTGALMFGKFEVRNPAIIGCDDSSIAELKGKKGVNLKLDAQDYFYFKEKDVFIKCNSPTGGKIKINDLTGSVLKNDVSKVDHVSSLNDSNAAKTSNFKFLKVLVRKEAENIFVDRDKDKILIESDAVSYVKPADEKSSYFEIKYKTKGDVNEKKIYVKADDGKLFGKLNTDDSLSEPMKISLINPDDPNDGFKLENDDTKTFAVKSDGDENVKFLYGYISKSDKVEFNKPENFYMEIDGDSEQKKFNGQEYYVIKFKTLLGGEAKIAYAEIEYKDVLNPNKISKKDSLRKLNEAADLLNEEIKSNDLKNKIKAKLIAEGKIVSGLEIIDNGGNAFENLKIGSSTKNAAKGYKIKSIDQDTKNEKYFYLAAETKDDFEFGKFYEMENENTLVDGGGGKPKAGKIGSLDNIFDGDKKALKFIYDKVKDKKEFKVEIEIANDDTAVAANGVTKNLKKVTFKVGGIDKTGAASELYFDPETTKFFNKNLNECGIDGSKVVELEKDKVFIPQDLKTFCDSVKYGEESKSIDDFVDLFYKPHNLTVTSPGQTTFPKEVEIYCGKNKFEVKVDEYGRLLDKDGDKKFIKYEKGELVTADAETATNVRTYGLDKNLGLVDKLKFVSGSIYIDKVVENRAVVAEMIDIWGRKKQITIRKNAESEKLEFTLEGNMLIKDGKFVGNSGDQLSEETMVIVPGQNNSTLGNAVREEIDTNGDKDKINKILDGIPDDKFSLEDSEICIGDKIVRDGCLCVFLRYKKDDEPETFVLWIDKDKNMYKNKGDNDNNPDKTKPWPKISFDKDHGPALVENDDPNGKGILDFIKDQINIGENDEEYKKIKDFNGVTEKEISFKEDSIFFEEDHHGFAKVELFVNDEPTDPPTYIYVLYPKYKLCKSPNKKDGIKGEKEAIKLGDNGEIEFGTDGDSTTLTDGDKYIPDFLVGLKEALEKNIFKAEFRYELAEELTSEQLKEMAKNNKRVEISVSTKVAGLNFKGSLYVDRAGTAYLKENVGNGVMVLDLRVGNNGEIELNNTTDYKEALKVSSMNGLKEKLKDFLNPEAQKDQNVLKTELVEAEGDDKKKYVILRAWIENVAGQKVAGSDEEFYIFKIGANDFILRDKASLEEGNEIHSLSVLLDGEKINAIKVDENSKSHYSFSKEILENELLKNLEEQKTQETKTETEPETEKETPTQQVYEPQNLKSKFEVKSVKAGKSKVGEKTDVDGVIFEIKGTDKKTVKVFAPDEEDALYNEQGKKVKLDEITGNVLELKESEENAGEENKLSNSELLLEAILRNNVAPKGFTAKIKSIEEKKVKDDSVKIFKQEGGKEDVQLEVTRRIAKIVDKEGKYIYFDLFTLKETDENGNFIGDKISEKEIGKRFVSFGEGDKTEVYDISGLSLAEKINDVYKILLGEKSDYKELLKIDADAGLKLLGDIYNPTEAKKMIDGFERFARDYNLFDENNKLNKEEAKKLFGEKFFIRTATGYVPLSIGALSGVGAGALAALVFSGAIVFPFAAPVFIATLSGLSGIFVVGSGVFAAEAISTKRNESRYGVLSGKLNTVKKGIKNIIGKVSSPKKEKGKLKKDNEQKDKN